MCSRPPAYQPGGAFFLLVSSAIWRFLTHATASVSQLSSQGHMMSSLDAIRARQNRRSGAPAPAPDAGRNRARGRHLGRARRPPAAVVFLQRLPQSHASIRPSSRPRSRRSRDTARAPAPRGWSPAITRSTPNWKRGWPRIKQTEAAVVFGSGYLANAGIIPVLIGARRSGAGRTNCRTRACSPGRNCRAARC